MRRHFGSSQVLIRKLVLWVPLSAAIFVSGCGGGGPAQPQAIQLQAIQLSPNSPAIAAGKSQQFTATGHYSDGTSKDLTNSATWRVLNSGVAAISPSGLVSAIAPGSSQVQATFQNVSGTTVLTVGPPVLVSLRVMLTSASIAKYTTIKSNAKGTFSDGSTQDVTGTVSWSSSPSSVASVSNTAPAQGLVRGLSAGNVSITASSGSISDSASLTVTNATLNAIDVTPTNDSIPLGLLQQFTATGFFSDSTTQDITNTVTWNSSSTNVAAITVSGMVSARDLGNTTISAAWESVSGSTSLNVNAANLSSIAILPGNATIAQSTSQQLSAIGTFNDGGTRNLTNLVAWTSSQTTVATVGASTARAHGLSPGIAMITATLGSVMNSVTLTVTNATIVSIAVRPFGRSIAPGTKVNFAAAGTFSDSNTQDITPDATWQSDNTAVATVSTTGTATGVATGTANIRAALNGVVGSASLSVTSATLTAISVTPAQSALTPASTLTYEATGKYSDGTAQNISNAVTWSSSDSNIATIGASSGMATGQSAGAATITATQAGTSGAASLVVSAATLGSITITPGSTSIPEQIETQFVATGTFQDGSTQNLTSSVTWTSSPASVATISDRTASNGLAKGQSSGTATITAVFAGVVGTASLNVTNATLNSVTVSPSSASIAQGAFQQFHATGNFSDGTTLNLTNQVTWNSSNVNVAVISSSGFAVSPARGTTFITAALNGVTSNSSVLTVQ